ncbi:MAG: DNA polymerase IV [Candidatus Methanoperedens sp.]|nr:DNA polymerase IV [Candidatus Methanoperedens sp.]
MQSPRIIIHMDMDYFFAQCEEKEHPEIKGKPVVICVYSGRSKDSGAVSTSNYEARKFGIKAGIPISQAKKLKPDAIFLPVNMKLYKSVSLEVMGILRGYCDAFEQKSIDEAFCDITGQVIDFDDARMYGIMIKKEILEKVGLTCSIGVAPSKLLAKIASDFQKPDGLTVVKPGDVMDFLAPLKITNLVGVGKKTEQRLNEMNVRTIGDMSGLSMDVLIREFGKAKGEWLKQASQGIDDSPLEEHEGTGQIGRIATLKEDTDDLSIINEVINSLSEDIHRKLGERKVGFKSIAFIAIATDFKTRAKSHTLAVPAKDLDTIKSNAHELAKEFLAENPVILRRVGVRVANLTEEKGQMTLGEF